MNDIKAFEEISESGTWACLRPTHIASREVHAINCQFSMAVIHMSLYHVCDLMNGDHKLTKAKLCHFD